MLIYPNVILAGSRRLEAPHARTTSNFNQIEQIWEEFDRKRNHFLATDAFPEEEWHFGIIGGGYFLEGKTFTPQM